MNQQLRDHIVQGLGHIPEGLDDVMGAFMSRELQRRLSIRLRSKRDHPSPPALAQR